MSFDEFWRVFPRKVGRVAAERAWKAAIKKDPPATILVGLDRSVKAWEAIGVARQFIPHGSTYLNQERWRDEPETPEGQEPEWYEHPQATERPPLKPKLRPMPKTRELQPGERQAIIEGMKEDARKPKRPKGKITPRHVPMPDEMRQAFIDRHKGK